jgi:hypothetical protein
MINHLFPQIDYTKLLYDNEGLYSITNPIEAEQISQSIKSDFINPNYINILDGTGGLGGNTINFSQNFKSVTVCEINKERYLMLVNNINQYDLKNVKTLNNDSVNYLFDNYNKYDVYFFDPPWGGPSYKKYKKLNLKIGEYSLLDIAKFLKNKTENKLLVYKIPKNYDINEFFEFDYKLYKINKYYIIILMI